MARNDQKIYFYLIHFSFKNTQPDRLISITLQKYLPISSILPLWLQFPFLIDWSLNFSIEGIIINVRIIIEDPATSPDPTKPLRNQLQTKLPLTPNRHQSVLPPLARIRYIKKKQQHNQNMMTTHLHSLLKQLQLK